MRGTGWSTREIAQLAGTTLRAVRHYHDIGLLAEPHRRPNGYKQYGVAHLVRILRIRRLTELGFSLSQIATMQDTDDQPVAALRTLDAELAATIERLQRARLELGVILRQPTPAELPSGVVAPGVVSTMPQADRSFIVVLTRVLGADTMRAWADMLRKPVTDPVAERFNTLPADADEQTRAAVARDLAPYVRTLTAENPGARITNAGTRYSAQYVRQAVGKALAELYNPAQLDVLRRTNRLLSDPHD
ncbi:MerR family transcriptional regulator [Micromonospora mirobrigensis]|uniref:DNA-binding transcriptional regulator, MerR family n=1 Tax=Micromonospora mirobrigensis TaxID=262898 RepID=A0A1C4YYH4_9ACTN|nr:MerR family transcriptional regulator [Micromonospora mirobrigensis]SCF25666.1 DNA-binding transcriptional regulator, MerR family [Micromonospora mirobrigensis]